MASQKLRFAFFRKTKSCGLLFLCASICLQFLLHPSFLACIQLWFLRPPVSTHPMQILLHVVPTAPMCVKPIIWMANTDFDRVFFPLPLLLLAHETGYLLRMMLWYTLKEVSLHRYSHIYLLGAVYAPHCEITITKRCIQIVLFSELCLRKTEIHLLKITAAALFQKMSLHMRLKPKCIRRIFTKLTCPSRAVRGN